MINRIISRILLSGILLFTGQYLYSQKVNTRIEYGATVFSGDNVPLWQAGMQDGLSSIENNTYVRGGAFYQDRFNSWTIGAGLDMAVAAGMTSDFVLQQAYIDLSYKWLDLSIGSKNRTPDLLNRELSSGDMSWSGNARPIPQVMIGAFDFIRLAKNVHIKGEMSFGWFTDNNYQKDVASNSKVYIKSIKYHHKSFLLRFGNPSSKFLFDAGLTLDSQFGGYQMWNGKVLHNVGNSFKDYIAVIIPHGGGEDDLAGEEYYKGNFTGNEYFRLTYQQKDFSLSAYLMNYYEDLSGMGKQNGWDGLWGMEYKTDRRQAVNGMVIEYLQTTNQSGPLHGIEGTSVEKTGGADNYYNHGYYTGWIHWGMAMGNPLLRSPIYNTNGAMNFLYNRVKALHLGWSGNISREVDYRAKLTYNQTWGTVFEPTLDILESFSSFVEVTYKPKNLKGWELKASTAFDTGDIYGDNWGMQFKINKSF